MREMGSPPRYRRRRQTPEWVQLLVGGLVVLLVAALLAHLVYGDAACAFQTCVKVVNVK